MRFNLDIQGMAGLQSDLNDLMFALPAAAARVGNFVAQSTAIRAKARIREGGRSGRVYELPSGTHQSLAPGEAPADLTGALANSITYTKAVEKNRFLATAGSNLAYAKTLELGGFVTTGVRFGGAQVYIEPRPFLYPSFLEAINAARGKLAVEVDRI